MGNTAPKQERCDYSDNDCSSPVKEDGKMFDFGSKKSAIISQPSLEEGTYSPRAGAAEVGTTINEKSLPTVFKWDKGGKDVSISGTFSDWKPIQMVKSKKEFIAIVEVPEGDHQYKFLVDGNWAHNATEPTVNNDMGTKNNVISVKQSDFEVFEALAVDSISRAGGGSSCTAAPGSPPGSYTQEPPVRNQNDKTPNPPCLPPQLLQVILNQEVSLMCEPTLLPEPNHVMLNHLYALSIKDDIMVLSATHRYEKKYVTTLLYKPI